MQRFFDILFSGTAIIVLSPLLIPVYGDFKSSQVVGRGIATRQKMGR